MMNGKKNGVQKEGVCHVHTYMRTFVLISIFTYYESFLKCSMMYIQCIFALCIIVYTYILCCRLASQLITKCYMCEWDMEFVCTHMFCF